MQRPKTKLIIFAKAPIPGFAKTRLIPAIGARAASELHKKLVEHTVSTALSCRSLNVELHISEAHPFFLRLFKKYHVKLVTQSQGNLGERMQSAFLGSNGPTLLMGSDCPVIDEQILLACVYALDRDDLTLLPAEDGGYGLIGMSQASDKRCHTLFSDIPWGSGKVLETTRQRLQKLDLSCSEPTKIWDVDRKQDLERLKQISWAC